MRFELLPIDHQIRQSAVSRGMLALPQAMWLKIQAGETSLEELMQVLPPDLCWSITTASGGPETCPSRFSEAYLHGIAQWKHALMSIERHASPPR